MSLYLFEIKEQATDMQKQFDYINFNYKKVMCNKDNKLIIKLENNDVYIYDNKYNLICKGRANLKVSRFLFDPIIIYDLFSTIDFVGGSLLLQNNIATFNYNGEGLPYVNSYRGNITLVQNRYQLVGY